MAKQNLSLQLMANSSPLSVSVTVPIYYTIERKTKASSCHLISDNWVRNLYHHTKNTVKQHYHKLIIEQLQPLRIDKFTLHLELFYKSTNCDPSNIFHQLEKYALDAFQEYGILSNDTVLFHLSTTTSIGGQDKSNPCCIITLTEAVNV